MLNQDRVQQLKDIVAGQRDLMFAAERHIWKHPETGYREWKTHAYLKEQYEKLGYQLTEAGNIPGFYTDIDTGKPGPKLLKMCIRDRPLGHPGGVHPSGPAAPLFRQRRPVHRQRYHPALRAG